MKVSHEFYEQRETTTEERSIALDIQDEKINGKSREHSLHSGKFPDEHHSELIGWVEKERNNDTPFHPYMLNLSMSFIQKQLTCHLHVFDRGCSSPMTCDLQRLCMKLDARQNAVGAWKGDPTHCCLGKGNLAGSCSPLACNHHTGTCSGTDCCRIMSCRIVKWWVLNTKNIERICGTAGLKSSKIQLKSHLSNETNTAGIDQKSRWPFSTIVIYVYVHQRKKKERIFTSPSAKGNPTQQKNHENVQSTIPDTWSIYK